MKKRILISALLASAVLLSSCSLTGDRSGSRRDRDDDDEDETERTEATELTEQTEASESTRETREVPEETTAPEGISDDVRSYAYSAYLSVLEENEESIRAYDWINISAQWENDGVLSMQDENQCALYDVTGDGLEELFIMRADDNRVMATLDVYSYDASAETAYTVLEVQGLDVQAGGGGYYFIAHLDDGEMLVYVSSGDLDWTDAYRVLEFDGYEFQVSASFEHNSSPNEDFTEDIDVYTADDTEISQDAYEALVAGALDGIDVLFEYNRLSDSQIVDALNGIPCYAASYDEVYGILSGSSDSGPDTSK